MNLSELMIQIKESPGSLLQDDCIFQLRAFIRGFILSKNTAAQGISSDHKLLESVDRMIKDKYGVAANERISIEEVLDDHEGDQAFNKYLELWFQYAQQ